jgi:hypothetical protein
VLYHSGNYVYLTDSRRLSESCCWMRIWTADKKQQKTKNRKQNKKKIISLFAHLVAFMEWK